MEIGLKFKNIRENRNIASTEVAKVLNWPLSKLSKIENSGMKLNYGDMIELLNYYELPFEFLDLDAAKNVMSKNSNKELSELIKRVSNIYDTEEFAGSEVGKVVTRIIPSVITGKANLNPERYHITGSIGKGQYAEVPWVAIFNKNITKSATKGIYVVYLISADMKTVYLSLNQGFTYFREKFGGKKGKKEIIKMADFLRQSIPRTSSATYKIDLKAEKSLAKGYEAAHITGIKYDINNLPSDEILIADLLDILDIYNNIYTQITKNRTIEQYYDFIVEKNQGLIEEKEEEEFLYTDSIKSREIEETLSDAKIKNEDFPVERKPAVIDDKGSKRYLRNPYIARMALEYANYQCEFDSSHKTFYSKVTSCQYLEAHHIIPVSFNDEFPYSLDVLANVVALCPLCHRQVHMAMDKEKEVILKKLYEKRKKRLERGGIYITYERLLKIYGIDKGE